MPKFEEYNEATQLQDSDLFVIKQDNQTKKITGRTIINSISSPSSAIEDNSLEFTKLKNVKKTVVNKFNKDTVAEGGNWIANSWRTNNMVCCSDYIPVTPNTYYYKTNSSLNNNVEMYDIDKNFVKNGSYSGRMLIPNNIYFIRTGMGLTEKDNFMFHIGGTAIDYVPYTNTNQDYINIIDGNYVKIEEPSKGGELLVFEECDPIGIGEPIFLETYYEGGNQPMHPKILDMLAIKGDKFNGYRFWMAYTPLPYYDEGEENPCIAVSNDLIYWTVPDGFDNFTNNPLDRPISSKEKYLSDTDLIYNPNTALLEVWYRGYQRSTAEYIYRKTSSDGVTWSDREEIYTMESTNATNLLCPSVIYENNKYYIWVVEKSATYSNGAIIRYESQDGTNWTNKTPTNITSAWHFGIIYNTFNKKYEILNYQNGSVAISYHYSDDGITWETPAQGRSGKFLVKNDATNYPLERDMGELYRPSFLCINGYYYVFLGMRTDSMKHELYLAVSEEKLNINSLKAISGYKSRMNIRTRRERFGTIGRQIFDTEYGIPVWCIQERTAQYRDNSKWIDSNGMVVWSKGISVNVDDVVRTKDNVYKATTSAITKTEPTHISGSQQPVAGDVTWEFIKSINN